MLRNLHIQNYALIESLDLDFTEGFSVITGETGAGKSILLGAIGLLTGQRAETAAIRRGATKCVVEGTFDVSGYALQALFEENDIEYEAECIVRREIAATGKSRAFINDTPVPLTILKQLGERLIDIHSQHQNLLLNTEGFQLRVLDTLSEDKSIRQQYAEAYRHYRDTAARLNELREQLTGDQGDEEYIRFQLEQFDGWRFQEGEQEELEQELELLTHAEDIKDSLYRIDTALSGDEGGQTSALRSIVAQLRSLSSIYPGAEEWHERMESLYIELKDIAGEVSDASESISFDPERQAWVEQRLDTIYTAQQKHRVGSVTELLDIAQRFRDTLQRIDEAGERIAAMEKETAAALEVLQHAAETLTAQRRSVATTFEKEIAARLIELGMPNTRFSVDITPRRQPDTTGADSVAFLFSANKNSALQNIADVASGGEISRIMLSLKSIIAAATAMPTLIFDEIDTGVSGTIAARMADIMESIAGHGRQVISITHLPQIAAKGTAHYKVYKEDTDDATVSHIRMLTTDERISELAQMMSSGTLTEAAINNARDMLGME
ncbi:MAG: DNA repair protein RecN [Bacteroidaceae bacterium]|nr:DNA repair protein RecN [Bacteroidaceae bacterium]